VFDPSQTQHDSTAPVLVIGAAGVDFVGRLEGPLEASTSNPARIRTSFGGVARNVAENLARLGQAVTLLAAVGDDESGKQLLQQAASIGIDVSSVLVLAGQPTATYLAVLGAEGELQFGLDDMRCMASLTSAVMHSNARLFKEAALVFVDANLPANTLRTVFSLARRAGVRVCADPTSASLARKLRRHLPDIYMTVPNSAEAGILCECEFNPSNRRQALQSAKTLVSKGVEIAIITLGENGVCYATAETSGRIPALHTEVTDPTGAGDAHTATVIYALLHDIPLDDAIRLGVTAASLTLGHRGSVLPDLSLELLYDRLVI
jgi:pseudouridine kinase